LCRASSEICDRIFLRFLEVYFEVCHDTPQKNNKKIHLIINLKKPRKNLNKYLRKIFSGVLGLVFKGEVYNRCLIDFDVKGGYD